MHIRPLIKKAEHITVANSPTILTVIGVVGTVTTAYLASRATAKAVAKLQEAAQSGHYVEPLSKKEKAEIVWKLYIPAVVSCAGTITCIISANRIGTKRTAALAAAASLSERAFNEYREKIVQTIGAEDEKEIRQQLMEEKARKNMPSAQILDNIMPEGECICHEAFTGRYFRSSKMKIEQACLDMNKQIKVDGSASLSEFYRRLGLPETSVSEELGWNNEKDMELLFSTVMFEDREPAISFDYATIPMTEYWRFV